MAFFTKPPTFEVSDHGHLSRIHTGKDDFMASWIGWVFSDGSKPMSAAEIDVAVCDRTDLLKSFNALSQIHNVWRVSRSEQS